jgi:UDP-N-acetylglucosamine 2-epimerase (non-hydrolysing)
LEEHELWDRASNELVICDPVGYIDFVRLVDAAETIATDSGGVQKEAFYLDTPCVTLRTKTEWRETVESGWNKLVGANESAIADAIRRAENPSEKPDIYGGGNASTMIVDILRDAADG